MSRLRRRRRVARSATPKHNFGVQKKSCQLNKIQRICLDLCQLLKQIAKSEQSVRNQKSDFVLDFCSPSHCQIKGTISPWKNLRKSQNFRLSYMTQKSIKPIFRV